ncbi:ShET2/EspL2 family type III secretion system effector toxin [Yersinia mollaretii]|uniref:ShET2/EspL2 family type III secretion system effector toxin n=1 Tax=Yersinia mollaretii TaxID=33060 RepID=UPI00155DBF58|nr:ShET2/EspL2 family type III secretion system effector toxin [Yersinia mollaretii]
MAGVVTRVENSPATLGEHDIRKNEKSDPYFSSKRDEYINLNGRAKSVDGDEILCRHLSPSWAENFIKNKGKVDYRELADIDTIRRNISPETLDSVPRPPAVVQMVGNAEWGRVLAESFSDMEKCGSNNRVLLIDTVNHSLAVGLKFKDSPEGQRCVIQFYDPNRTVAHQRAVFHGGINDCLSQIEKLAAKDFLTARHLESYRLKDGNIAAFFDRHAAVPAMTLSRLPDGPLHPEVFYHCMTLGLTEVLQSIADSLNCPLKRLSTAEVIELLATKGSYGASGLCMALQNGHEGAIQAYGEIILTAKLPAAKVAELLAAKCDNGLPGLQLALQNGHADAIREYGQIIQTAGLPAAKVAELLAAKNHDGVPGLMMVLNNGYADAIREYGQIIQTAGLPADKVAELLASKRHDGVPGLYLALQKGHADAIRVYGQIIRAAKLPAVKVTELLDPKYNGFTGLHMALNNGHADAIRAYGQIIQTAGLPAAKVAELLAAKSDAGVPGLLMAIYHGHADAIRAYGKIIQTAKFPAKKMAELLATKHNGVSVLQMVLQQGHANAIREYEQIIQAAGLSHNKVIKQLRGFFKNLVLGLFKKRVKNAKEPIYVRTNVK